MELRSTTGSDHTKNLGQRPADEAKLGYNQLPGRVTKTPGELKRELEARLRRK